MHLGQNSVLIAANQTNLIANSAAKCRMVLSYDAYNETMEDKNEKDKQIELLAKKQEKFEQLIQSLIESGQLKPNM